MVTVRLSESFVAFLFPAFAEFTGRKKPGDYNATTNPVVHRRAKMDMVRETMNVGNICKATIPEVFARALPQVLESFDDINRPAEQTRKVVLEFNK
jgi:hypothetical protein